MLEQDYLVRIFVEFAAAMRRSMQRAAGEHNVAAAAEMLDNAVGQATDMESNMLLSLSPDSVAAILKVSGVDPRVIEYVVRSLLLASRYLREANEDARADVREAQAYAVAKEYGIDLSEALLDPEALDEFFAQI